MSISSIIRIYNDKDTYIYPVNSYAYIVKSSILTFIVEQI